MSLERFRERRRVLVPVVQGVLDNGCRPVDVEGSRGAFEPRALHIIDHRLAGDALEDAMEMKRREAGDARNVVELQRAVEIGLDIRNRPRDSGFVLGS